MNTAALSHHQVPESGLVVPGALTVTTAVLCPSCLGDWCADCDWSGMARPLNVPAGTRGEDASARRDPLPLLDAVEAWCLGVITTREVVPA